MRKWEIEAITLELNKFGKPKRTLEQYMTQPTQASEAILKIREYGDIEGKIIADLGAGTGMLGLTALICGAK